MFEKEAEEYVQEIEVDECVIIPDRKKRKMDFQNGAEFGYNGLTNGIM